MEFVEDMFFCAKKKLLVFINFTRILDNQLNSFVFMISIQAPQMEI